MTALELRAADPQQRAMLHTYLTDAALPQRARVLEVGCGTSAVTRVVVTWPGVAKTIGVDPSPVFVAKARELAGGLTTLAFQEADGRSLPFAYNAFDAVVFHTTLCHVPEPEVMLHEAVWISGRVVALRYSKATTPQAHSPREPETRSTPVPGVSRALRARSLAGTAAAGAGASGGRSYRVRAQLRLCRNVQAWVHAA